MCTSRSAGPPSRSCSIRLRGPALAAARGPFDTAVVYEGEHTLLPALCRALDDARPARRCRTRPPRHPEPGPARSHVGREVHARRGERGHAGLAAARASTDWLSTSTSRPSSRCFLRSDARLLLGQVHVLSLWPRHEIGTASYPRARRRDLRRPPGGALGQARDAAILSVAGLGGAQDDRPGLAGALADAGLPNCAGPPDLKPERYLTAEAGRDVASKAAQSPAALERGVGQPARARAHRQGRARRGS